MNINHLPLQSNRSNYWTRILQNKIKSTNMACFSLILTIVIAIISQFWPSITFAENRVVDLTISYKTVNFAGKTRKVIAVNDQIPAPTLHFKQGDHVIINVHNCLDEGSAIHWHGILVPWQMDGVEGVNQKAIPPGGIFRYEFTLEQSGTYWYHAHANVQEQEGLYGAFVIDPAQPPTYKYTKDYVIVLSDWSNIKAEQVFANLKKDGDYFSPWFPLQPSLVRFLHDYNKASCKEQKEVINDYMMMQYMRMSIYDISDVAYNAFLLNGRPETDPWIAPVKVGDVVRLKFIGAGGSTIFRVKIPGSSMEMVHVQGNDVEPYTINDFTIAPGETYDVLVKIKKDTPYIIYAESSDTLGAAYGALVTDHCQVVDFAQATPFPEPLPTTREMMANMMMSGMGHGAHSMANDSSMKMGMGTKSSHAMHSMEGMAGAGKKEMSSSMVMPQHQNMKGEIQKKKNTMETHHTSHQSNPGNSSNASTMSGMDHKTYAMKEPTSNQTKSSTASSQKNITQMSHDKMDMSSMNMSSKQKNKTSSQTMKNSNANHSMHQMSNSMKMGTGMKMGTDMKMGEPMSLEQAIKMAKDMTAGKPMPMDLAKAKTAGTKYQNLKAAVKTNDPNKPIQEVIRMDLFGWMDRFIWMINGKAEHEAHPIMLEPGKRYRIIFTNNSMMHHPMHIHGHWFILRNGQAEYDPLLHTIDMAPGATAVADIDADASGQWFFHCHHLYHMMSGMARVFQYNTIIDIAKCKAKPQKIIAQQPYINRPIIRDDITMPLDCSLITHPMAHPPGLYLSSFLDVGEDPFHNVQKVNFKGLYGSDYHKLELYTDDAEIKKGEIENADMDIFYWHLIDQFWAVKAGVNYYYRPARTPYWQPGIGIEGLMPYFIDTNARVYYHRGSVKLDVELSRDSQITNNFFIGMGARSILATKTVVRDEIGSGLNQMRYIVRPYYRLMPGLAIFMEYEHEQSYGALKNIRRNLKESISEDTLTFGLSILF
jgi:CopA family copper-resistance protein